MTIEYAIMHLVSTRKCSESMGIIYYTVRRSLASYTCQKSNSILSFSYTSSIYRITLWENFSRGLVIVEYGSFSTPKPNEKDRVIS